MARGRNNKKPSSSKKTGKPGKGEGKGQAEASYLQTSSSEALQYPKIMEGSAEGRQGKVTPSSASFDNVAKPEEPKKVDFKGKEKESLPAHDTTSLREDTENFSSRMEDERRRAHSLACERVRDNTAPGMNPPLLPVYILLFAALFSHYFFSIPKNNTDMLPAEVQATRSEAITLIRARTLSRLSTLINPQANSWRPCCKRNLHPPKNLLSSTGLLTTWYTRQQTLWTMW